MTQILYIILIEVNYITLYVHLEKEKGVYIEDIPTKTRTS